MQKIDKNFKHPDSSKVCEIPMLRCVAQVSSLETSYFVINLSSGIAEEGEYSLLDNVPNYLSNWMRYPKEKYLKFSKLILNDEF